VDFTALMLRAYQMMRNEAKEKKEYQTNIDSILFYEL
jgi:hypothetical protein